MAASQALLKRTIRPSWSSTTTSARKERKGRLGLGGELPVVQQEAGVSATDVIGDRIERAQAVIAATRARWQWLLDHINDALDSIARPQDAVPAAAFTRHAGGTLFQHGSLGHGR